MDSLSHLAGASHSQDQLSATSHGIQKPCLSNHAFGKGWCNDPVCLDVQILRVCRQIYDEAGLIPYAKNHFLFSHGLFGSFQEAFVAQFDLEKRSAMHTVAVLRAWAADIGLVFELLPGLKRLWYDVYIMAYDPFLTLAANQSKLVETYSHVKFPSLIGVTVKHQDPIAAKDEGMEERLELALLNKKECDCRR